MHEMLHVLGLGGDTQLATAFGITEQVKSQGSVAITYKLMGECGK